MTGSTGKFAASLAMAALAFTLAGCSVNVDKDDKGNEKKVDIRTPFGSLNVNTDKVSAKDTGFNVYPGAQEKAQTEHDKNKANVNIDTPMFGVKVSALTYLSPDDPAKVLAFYRNDIKTYGNFVECKGSGAGAHHKGTNSTDDLEKPVTCDSDVQVDNNDSGDHANDSKSITLKSGTNGNQHVVTVKPTDKGSEFSIVHVEIHGSKQKSI